MELTGSQCMSLLPDALGCFFLWILTNSWHYWVKFFLRSMHALNTVLCRKCPSSCSWLEHTCSFETIILFVHQKSPAEPPALPSCLCVDLLQCVWQRIFEWFKTKSMLCPLVFFLSNQHIKIKVKTRCFSIFVYIKCLYYIL